MQTDIKKMINTLERINNLFREEDKEFDVVDVIETYNRAHKILEKISDDLRNPVLKDKQKIEMALVEMNTELSNLIWCFDELRDLAIRTLRKIN